MKVSELLNEARSNLSYDAKTKKIYGSAKEWNKAWGVTDEHAKEAFKKAEDLPSYKELMKLVSRNKPKGREANGTFEFNKPSGEGLYVVLSNGQIRSENTKGWYGPGPTRLKSPKPTGIHGDPTGSLLKMYDNSFKELLDKLNKGAGKGSKY